MEAKHLGLRKSRNVTILKRRCKPLYTLFPYTTLFRSRSLGALATGKPLQRQEHAGGSSIREQDRKSTRLNSSHITNSYAFRSLEKKIWPSTYISTLSNSTACIRTY